MHINLKKTNLKNGVGKPCAGHNNDNVILFGTLYGFDIIDGIRGAVLDTGSARNLKYLYIDEAIYTSLIIFYKFYMAEGVGVPSAFLFNYLLGEKYLYYTIYV